MRLVLWSWLLGLCLLVGCASGADINPRGQIDGGSKPSDATLPTDGGSAEHDAGPPDRDGDGVADDIDCDPDDPSVGIVAETECSSPCAQGVSQCAQGVWSPCSASDDCDCTLGEMRSYDCVQCGQQWQRCQNGRWVDDGTCTSMGECSPGDLETRDDETCGLGGKRSRMCSSSCSFGGWECSAGTPPGLWVLPSGATRWLRYPLDPSGSPFAPTESIEVAFSFEDRHEAFVLTRNRYHVLRTTDRQWLRSGLRDDLFPEVSGKTLLGGYTTPRRLNDPGSGRAPDVTLMTSTHYYVYEEFNAATGTSVAQGSGPCCADRWTNPLAPLASNVRGMWLDPDNNASWPGSTHPTCGAPEDFYFAVVAAPERIHVQSAECAFEFVENSPFRMFAPFKLPDAPSFADVQGIFYHSGLFVLANP